MTIIQYIYLYLLTIPMLVLFDLLWIGVVAKDFYKSNLGHLFGPVEWTPAIIFYFVYIAGLLFFVVAPALEVGSLMRALVLGALFGFVAYATYDLTNNATIKDWPTIVTIVDILWGSLLTGGVAALSYLIGKALFF